MADEKLSDEALSILAFAAYHALTSGEKVRDVVLDDGNGHQASSRGVEELRAAGHLDVDNRRGRLTDSGEARLDAVLAAIRSVAGTAG